MGKMLFKKPVQRTAQAIIELMIFGSVIFFLIGAIASNYVGSAYQQEMMLRTNRIALLRSWTASTQGLANRSSASYLIYEDRLTAEFGRYNIDRMPIVSMGGGMLTFMAMKPVDWPAADTWVDNMGGLSIPHPFWRSVSDSERDNISVMDVAINGKEFQLRASGFVQYEILLRSDVVEADTVADMDVSGGKVVVVRSNPNPWDGTHSITAVQPGFPSVVPTPTCPTCTRGGMINDCINHSSAASSPAVGISSDPTGDLVRYFCSKDGDPEELSRKRLAFEWKKYQDKAATGCVREGWPDPYNAFVFYSFLPDTDADFLSCSSSNRCFFDGTRNGVYTDDLEVPGGTTKQPWSWKLMDFDTLLAKIDQDGGNFPSADINGDMVQETIYSMEKIPSETYNGHTYQRYEIKVMDPGAGDINMSLDPANVPPELRQGVQADMRIFSKTECVLKAANPQSCNGQEVTYFEIKEGKAYSTGGGHPLGISLIKKNTYDIVERVYQANPNMIDPEGFLCNNGTAAVVPDSACLADSTQSIEAACEGAGSTGGVAVNGQEYNYLGSGAGCCQTIPDNLFKTCFNKTTKTLYIRSRISDKRGRRWVTATDQDLQESLGSP